MNIKSFLPDSSLYPCPVYKIVLNVWSQMNPIAD